MGDTGGDLWVFGYGSLIWHPGFDFVERRIGVLRGYARSFCMTSIHYRGTPERPGLVLALDADPEGVCEGVLFRVARPNAEATLAYLRERELVSYAYLERVLPVEQDSGETLAAVSYVMNRDHPQYRGDLDLEGQAAVIAEAAGPRGPNADYLFNTVRSLDDLGLVDAHLLALADLVRARL
jgi:glutathione-specific gamma-glutamylcyclotransferase